MKKFVHLLFFAVLPLFALEEEELVWDDSQGPSVQEYNSALQEAIAAQNWWTVVDYADFISYNFPTSPFAEEASFILGEAYFKLNLLEYSNECFTAYLNHTASPKHFEKAIHYKFQIAQKFGQGAKMHLFGSHKLPAWMPAEEEAIKIYDEVIAALPHAEITATALLHKAQLQVTLEDFKPSLETLDLLIRRFPKQEVAAEAYLEKAQVYLIECQNRNLDPDLLDLADVNLRKFRLAFPREVRLTQAEKRLADMQEIFAQNLFDTGKFFQKTKKVPAAVIYYKKVVAKYPATEAAVEARKRLESLAGSA